MSELVVIVALIPLSFITLPISSRSQMALQWIAATMGAIVLGYFLWMRAGSPLQWGAVLALSVLLLADFIQERKTAPLTVLSAIFISLASITSELGVIIIFLAFSDIFLETQIFSKGNLSEKNRAIKNVYRSMLSLLPAGLAVILQAQGETLAVAVAVTIALRVFSWPLRHWVNTSASRFYYLVIGGASTFALWRSVDFSNQPEWSLIWLIAAGVLSLGAKEIEVYIAMTLGMFSLSPQLGLLGIGLWILALNQSRTTYLIYFFIGASGALIADAATRVVVENACYGISFATALLLSRNLVSVKTEPHSWYKDLGAIFLCALVIVPFIYLMPAPQLNISAIGLVFLGTFILSFILGKFLMKRKPRLFGPVPHLRLQGGSVFFKSVDLLRERSGPLPAISQKTYLVRFFDVLDSEGHLVWLLGVLGLAIWWGVR
jgi:hypothetical protein